MKTLKSFAILFVTATCACVAVGPSWWSMVAVGAACGLSFSIGYALGKRSYH